MKTRLSRIFFLLVGPLFLVAVSGITTDLFGQERYTKAVEIDAGRLTETGYVNDELKFAIDLPPDSRILMADGLSQAAKGIADKLRTGEAKNDKRLDIQENEAKVLLKVDLARPSTFLSVAVGRQRPGTLKELALSTHEVLLKTGQYVASSPVQDADLSSQPTVTFTVKKNSEPISYWRLYALRRNGFQITIGLVYSSDEGLKELDDVVKDIRFF